MAGTVLASVPVNSEAGAYLTFAFPIILFCAIGAVLYILLFGRPHPRVPARRIAVTAVAHAGPPDPDAAHAAAIAGGLPLAEGGGSAESGTEAAGAVAAALAETGEDGVAHDGPETGRDGVAHDGPETGQDSDGGAKGTAPTDGTEASE